MHKLFAMEYLNTQLYRTYKNFHTSLMNCRIFYIILIFAKIKSFQSRTDLHCSKLHEHIPDQISCPSFDYTVANWRNGSINMFCRMLTHHICMFNFDSDPHFSIMWQNVACRMQFQNFNSHSELGLIIREKIRALMKEKCIKYIEYIPGTNIQNIHYRIKLN